MTQIVLFHSGLGLRPHVGAWKTALEEAGHRVLTPDLYDGEVFETLTEGVKKRDALGIPELSRRASAAVESLPQDVVYAGFSLGAAAAQALALGRPGARGLVMMHGALPLAALGVQTWPRGLNAQLHTTLEDPWVARDAVGAVVSAAGSELQHFEYPGQAHLFADPGQPDFDAQMADSMFQRVRAFVASV